MSDSTIVSRGTILHVDDDPAVLRLVAARLEREGYRVISIDNPQRAIAALLEHDCRVVILDVMMPEMTGLELLAEIKRYDGGVQVIMLTGLVSSNTVLESLRCGAERCLFKPIESFAPLCDALQAAFRKLEHWRETLADLQRRRHVEQLAV